MTTEEHPYQMTLSLNVLRHLGLGLYSNVAAVLSEVVANAWDADAEHVSISIDSDAGRVIIQDDGHGMTVEDANRKYLRVGYERRKEEARTPKFERPVMGRKGIGKLSLFSIARTVEVHSVREKVKHGFIMDSQTIEEIIKGGEEAQYNPVPVDSQKIDFNHGTRIILTNMKRKLQWTPRPLRRRLARRFSVIGPLHQFEVELDGQPITVADRDYQDKLQYVWTYGDTELQSSRTASHLKSTKNRPSIIEIDGQEFAISGWIGTALTAGQLKDSDTSESINKIVIMVRGKLAQEDILEEFGEGGLYTKYILGEIHADFLDLDDYDDIATTSRQRLIEEDPRYQALKSKLLAELKHIQNRWTELRNQQGAEEALVFPQIEEWFEDLDSDQRKAAKKLFGRINQLPIDDSTQKRQLFVSGILAFESLRLRNILHRLDEVSPENLGVLNEVFVQLDDLEASVYYQIAKERLEVIRKLQGLVDEVAKERALQEHLYQHLWLLDPSWERATHTEVMEKRISTALEGVADSLSKKQRNARIDIYYSTTGNKHVIIELKRANRVLSSIDLLDQVIGYQRAAKRVLSGMGKGDEPLEIICVVGRSLKEWNDYPDGEALSREALKAYNARVVYYDQLINNALQAYQDYIDSSERVGRIYRLIQEVSDQDVEAISPEVD